MSAGTSSGRPQSAVLVPVPEADAVVGRWRQQHDPVAAAGVPAHITLIVPWLPPGEITVPTWPNWTACSRTSRPSTLSSITWTGSADGCSGWLPNRLLRSLRLTDRLADHFGTPPWEDEFDEVVPHLTVAHASDGVELVPVAADLSGRLPVACRAKRCG